MAKKPETKKPKTDDATSVRNLLAWRRALVKIRANRIDAKMRHRSALEKARGAKARLTKSDAYTPQQMEHNRAEFGRHTLEAEGQRLRAAELADKMEELLDYDPSQGEFLEREWTTDVDADAILKAKTPKGEDDDDDEDQMSLDEAAEDPAPKPAAKKRGRPKKAAVPDMSVSITNLPAHDGIIGILERTGVATIADLAERIKGTPNMAAVAEALGMSDQDAQICLRALHEFQNEKGGPA